VYERIRPYIFIKDNIQFHYIPDTPANELYRYWLPNPEKHQPEQSRKFFNSNFSHAKAGFEFYLNNIIRLFEKDDIDEAAKFIGCLLHMLQDSCFGLHSLEGPYGMNIFAFDGLFDKTNDFSQSPLYILSALEFGPEELSGYTPAQLGESVPEMIIHLYAAYVKTVCASRRICFKVIQNSRNGNTDGNPALIREMFSGTVKICADTLFSARAIACRRFQNSGHLAKTCLTDLEPFKFPLGGSGGYRFFSFQRDFAVDAKMQKIPLALKMDNHQVVAFEKGISLGSHFQASLEYWLPDNLFSVFEACIGLHPDPLSSQSGIKIQVLNNGKCVRKLNFDINHPTARIKLKNPRGRFGFKISYSGKPQTDIIVIADPHLKKP
jgi:hypothetical protein